MHQRARRAVKGLRLVVVDDQVTTGATMSACASALKEAGASQVKGIAVARSAAAARCREHSARLLSSWREAAC